MNRQQRRIQQQNAQPGMVNLNDITWLWQMTTAECAMMAEDRLTTNYLQTRHPYHHLTANGVIVSPDPTLEYYLQRMEQDETYTARLALLRNQAEQLDTTNAPKAMPVNRKFYGHDPFERH